MDEKVGLKELYDINIRLNQPLEIGNRKYDINETILSFKTADIAQIQQSKDRKEARGGFGNNLLLDWETDKEVSFAISNGVLSPLSWAVLSNSKLNERQTKSVSYREELEVVEDDDFWFVELKYCPNHIQGKMGIQGNPEGEQMPMGRRPWLPLKPLPPKKDKFIFCYDLDTGGRIMKFDVCDNKVIFKGEHRKVMVDYTFDYDDGIKELNVGSRLFNGFLNLTGKMTTKDYFSGEPKTAILEIPRLKINSSLSMRLGSSYDNPVVSDFYFTGYPEENRRIEDQKVFNITFLNSDLTEEYL